MSRNGLCGVVLAIVVAACGGSAVVPATSSMASSGSPSGRPAGSAGLSATVSSPSASPAVGALPSFAEDEPLVLFNRLTGAGGGVYVAQLDGSSMQKLAADVPGVHKRGDWSPDGQKVVFIDETERMMIAHLDGSPTEHVPACDRPGCDFPSWSPDGTRIAFSRAEGSAPVGPGSVSINIVELASGKVTTVTKMDRPFLADVPRWSPDGRQIVFGIDRMDDEANETGAAVAVASVTGGAPHVLTEYELFGYVPDWSWTRNEIVFSTDIAREQKDFDPTGKTWDLWLIQPDGTGLRNLTKASDGHRLAAPRWTPDGTRITAYDFATPGGIIVDAATGRFEPFVTTGNFTRPIVRPVP